VTDPGYSIFFTTKKGVAMNPSKHKMSVLAQIFKLIPQNLIPKLANEHGVDKQSRSLSPVSHVLALMFGQLAHSLGLNDICDALRNHSEVLTTIREATPLSRNGFSHANRTRNADMAEDLFWKVFEHLDKISPGFRRQGRNYCAILARFKRVINVVDSTTIQLVANCMDWAKHRWRKAAAKMHLRLDLHSFLPSFVLVKAANSNDAKEARTVCAGISSGEIVVFDRRAWKSVRNTPRLASGIGWTGGDSLFIPL
jgi:hypothetical protein